MSVKINGTDLKNGIITDAHMAGGTYENIIIPAAHVSGGGVGATGPTGGVGPTGGRGPTGSAGPTGYGANIQFYDNVLVGIGATGRFSFALEVEPDTDSLTVFYNGLKMAPGVGNDYTLKGVTFTFIDEEPHPGAEIEASFRRTITV